MNIKVTTVNDKRAVKALMRLAFFGKHDPKKRMLMWGAIALIYNIFLIGSCVMLDDFAMVPYFLLVDLIFVVLYAYGYWLLPHLQYKRMGKFADTVNEFTFTDDGIEIVTEHKEYSGKEFISYSMIASVKETSEYIMIFPDKTRAYPMNKASFPDGSADEVRQKLMPILGKNYIVCKY